MAETLHLVEQIARAIHARLKQIEQIAGEPIAGVLRPTRLGGYSPQHMLIVLEQDDEAINAELSVAGNPPATAKDQPFRITVLVRPSDRSDAPIDTLLNAARYELEKALNEDVQWGGLAINTAVGVSSKVITVDRAMEGVEFTPVVTYRASDADPSVVRGA